MGKILELKWYTKEIKDAKGKMIPKWARSIAVSDDEQVFIPAIMAATQLEVWLCATHDGAECLFDHGHLYVDATWVEKTYPLTNTAIANIRRMISGIATA
jgi:hypothetical protein